MKDNRRAPMLGGELKHEPQLRLCQSAQFTRGRVGAMLDSADETIHCRMGNHGPGRASAEQCMWARSPSGTGPRRSFPRIRSGGPAPPVGCKRRQSPSRLESPQTRCVYEPSMYTSKCKHASVYGGEAKFEVWYTCACVGVMRMRCWSASTRAAVVLPARCTYSQIVRGKAGDAGRAVRFNSGGVRRSS